MCCILLIEIRFRGSNYRISINMCLVMWSINMNGEGCLLLYFSNLIIVIIYLGRERRHRGR